MTEIEMPLANFSPIELQKLSPEALTDFKATLARAGFSSERIDGAVSKESSPPINSSAVAPPFKVSAMENSPDNFLTPDQRRTGAETLSKFWNGRVDNDGQPISASPPGAQYALSYGADAASMGENFRSFDAEYRGALAAAEIPASHAQGLLDAVLENSRAYSALSKEEVSTYRRTEMSKLNKMSGRDEIMQFASLAYERLPQSFRDRVGDFSGLDSANAYVALSNVGRQLAYNDNKRGNYA